MTSMGRIGAALIVSAAALCAFASAASAQVRTVGPEAPYLMTGRSVSVPPYHQVGQQAFDPSSSQQDRMNADQANRPRPADAEQSAPK
jgi:hypothetical protein